ncbi:hypothetical protein [Veronia pacifica]|nr:hypothetical protein [Veronia pacifica]
MKLRIFFVLLLMSLMGCTKPLEVKIDAKNLAFDNADITFKSFGYKASVEGVGTEAMDWPKQCDRLYESFERGDFYYGGISMEIGEGVAVMKLPGHLSDSVMKQDAVSCAQRIILDVNNKISVKKRNNSSWNG